MLIFRIRKENGERYLPAETRDGRFQLADPALGVERHHAKNAIFANTIEEAVLLIQERRFSLWMKGEQTKQRNLISADQINIAGERK